MNTCTQFPTTEHQEAFKIMGIPCSAQNGEDFQLVHERDVFLLIMGMNSIRTPEKKVVAKSLDIDLIDIVINM